MIKQKRNWEEEELNDEGIKDYLHKIIAYANKNILFYEEGRNRRKLISNTFLTLAVVAFAFSFIYPLFVKGEGEPKNLASFLSYYKISFITAVIASISLLFDRLFGHSEAWMRYTVTKMQLQRVVSEFHGRWIQMIQGIDLRNSTLEQKNELMKMLLEFDQVLRDVVIGETETWKKLFTLRIKEFNEQVAERLRISRTNMENSLEQVQKNIAILKEEETKRTLKGSLMLLFTREEKDNINLELKGESLDKGISFDLEPNQHSKAFVDLKFGVYVLKVISKKEDETPKLIEKIITIDKEATKEVTIDLK